MDWRENPDSLQHQTAQDDQTQTANINKNDDEIINENIIVSDENNDSARSSLNSANLVSKQDLEQTTTTTTNNEQTQPENSNQEQIHETSNTSTPTASAANNNATNQVINESPRIPRSPKPPSSQHQPNIKQRPQTSRVFNIKKEQRANLNSFMNESDDNHFIINENPIFITHVTLTLDVLNNRPAMPLWKYNTVRHSYTNYNYPNISRSISSPNRKAAKFLSRPETAITNEKSFFLTSTNQMNVFELQNSSGTTTSTAQTSHVPRRPKSSMAKLNRNAAHNPISSNLAQPQQTDSEIANQEHDELDLDLQENYYNVNATNSNNTSLNVHNIYARSLTSPVQQLQLLNEAYIPNKMLTNMPTVIKSTKTTRISSSASSASRFKNTFLNHQKSNTRVNTPSKVSYMDIFRPKSSAFEGSVSSIESQRSNGKHNYTVAEFNKFKNKLLTTNHSRLSYMGEYNTNEVRPLSGIGTFAPTESKTKSLHNLNSTSAKQLPLTTSQIRSIYETIRKEATTSKIKAADTSKNPPKAFSVELKRSNYANSLKSTHNFLSSSLQIKKIDHATK